jgi:hypothetical protein
MEINAQYNIAKPDSLPAKIAAHQRRKMYQAFLVSCDPASTDKILDVGVTSDRGYDHSNYFEAWYPHKSQITAAGVDDATFLEETYPGLQFIKADGTDLPFEDKWFDFVHSSAVLEHVGSEERQAQFLRELWRVARKGIFVTTPNRWFPVEFHTVLPLLHWLPKPTHRKILKLMKREFFAKEENLNLLSRRSLAQAAKLAAISEFQISSVSLVSLPTNLLLSARRS